MYMSESMGGGEYVAAEGIRSHPVSPLSLPSLFPYLIPSPRVPLVPAAGHGGAL